MAHVTDYKRDSMLTIVGGTNTNIDDLEITYLQSLGATSDHVNNAWMEVFLANSATSGNWNNAAVEFLDALGATGDGLPAKWYWFWVTNGGVIVTATDVLLLESGFGLLLESGFGLLLEA
jgi:hypothetical protein